MGKKIVLGCLGVGVLVLVVGGYFIYTMLVKPVTAGMSVLKDINEANEQIVNRSTYYPPATGELSTYQVERFVAVQSSIRQGLEGRLTEFEKKYEELNKKWEGREPTVREIMGAWGDVAKLYSDAKRIQVGALNTVGFSLDEYRFVQQSFYNALGYGIFSYNIDMIARSAGEGGFDFNFGEFDDRPAYLDEIPAVNVELVAPYVESADMWITFAWLGL